MHRWCRLLDLLLDRLLRGLDGNRLWGGRRNFFPYGIFHSQVDSHDLTMRNNQGTHRDNRQEDQQVKPQGNIEGLKLIVQALLSV